MPGPLVRLFDVETSHKIGILAAKLGLFPRETRPDPPSLRTTVWGREFPNPLGGSSNPAFCPLLPIFLFPFYPTGRGGGAAGEAASGWLYEQPRGCWLWQTATIMLEGRPGLRRTTSRRSRAPAGPKWTQQPRAQQQAT